LIAKVCVKKVCTFLVPEQVAVAGVGVGEEVAEVGGL
jgi:hypothetical protein